MIKTVKIFEIGKKFFSKKIKVMARDGWIYDFEWRMGFQNENYWKQFLNKIKKAEEDVEAGRVIPWEEFVKEMESWKYEIEESDIYRQSIPY